MASIIFPFSKNYKKKTISNGLDLFSSVGNWFPFNGVKHVFIVSDFRSC